jgi:hypothetical protein
MKILNIESTEKTPSVYLDTDGTLNIEGRSIIEDPTEFYDNIVKELEHVDGNTLTITLDYEFFNTASARAIMRLLKSFDDFEAKVVWMYETGDDDMKEAGEDYQEIMYKYSKMPFKIVEK